MLFVVTKIYSNKNKNCNLGNNVKSREKMIDEFVDERMPILSGNSKRAEKDICATGAVNQKIWQGSSYKIISAAIQRSPSFWLWTHNRWKRTYEEFVIRQTNKNGELPLN